MIHGSIRKAGDRYIVVADSHLRCFNCGKLLLKSNELVRGKADMWSCQIKCGRCKTINYFMKR